MPARLFFMLISSVVALMAFDIDILKPKPSNAESTLIVLDANKSLSFESVTVDAKRYPILPAPNNPSKYYALIPFSYYEKPSKKAVTIHYNEKKVAQEKRVWIYLQSGTYAKEKIHVAASKVNPKSAAVQKRIAAEYKEAMAIYHTKTPHNYLRRPFILPLESAITSEFGKARLYNGTLKGYHSGTDFRAKVGTPIKAANDGRVVLCKDRFYSGGTVIVDHGAGLYSCYFHMSQFAVKKGDRIKRGDLLGLSGASGRVTGPHLHFAVRLYGVQVDPLQLIALLNNNLLKEKQQ